MMRGKMVLMALLIFVSSIPVTSQTLVPQETTIELSNNKHISIPEQPACAQINITGITSLPTEKGTDAQAWMDVWDGRGAHFRKRVIIDLNGETSVAKEKRNFSAVFCEDEWQGKETTKIKIGRWVTQDGFHFKANYTSITKGECAVSYKLFDKFLDPKPAFWAVIEAAESFGADE